MSEIDPQSVPLHEMKALEAERDALLLRVAALESEVVATRREVMPCNCAELPAERADADRLAKALKTARPIVAGFNVDGTMSVVDAALAEHDAMRGKGEAQ